MDKCKGDIRENNLGEIWSIYNDLHCVYLVRASEVLL